MATHASARRQQVDRQSTGASSDIEHQIPGADLRTLDHPAGPEIRQLVVAPAGPPFGGHGAL